MSCVTNNFRFSHLLYLLRLQSLSLSLSLSLYSIFSYRVNKVNVKSLKLKLIKTFSDHRLQIADALSCTTYGGFKLIDNTTKIILFCFTYFLSTQHDVSMLIYMIVFTCAIHILLKIIFRIKKMKKCFFSFTLPD